MGYNGNNRGASRRRNEHRGAYRSGEKLLGGIIVGLLGLSVTAAKEIGTAAQNSSSPQPQDETNQYGWGCLIPAAIVLVPLNLLGLMLCGLPLIGWVIAMLLVYVLYGVFEGCSLSVKKLPMYAKILFWIALFAFCLACSYWMFDVDDILPSRAIDQTGNKVWCMPNYLDLELWLLGGAFPFVVCVGGYLSYLYKARKKRKNCTLENIEKP